MSIRYTCDTEGLSPEHLTGFFDGWPNPPDPETHLTILKNSHAVWLAFDGSQCVGFINAISDGVFYSFIPLLEVLPSHKGRGIGSELVQRMVSTLGTMYAIDIVCDETVAPFYERKAFHRCVGMVKRNHENQQGSTKAP